MDRDDWKLAVAFTRALDRQEHRRRPAFSDAQIVETFLWARFHGRPACWACDRRNWPMWERRRALPSASTLSRRLRTASVGRLLDGLEERLRPAWARAAIVHAVDGKPLPVARHSRDRHAGFGRGAGGMDRGYKLHALVGPCGAVVAWCVAPLSRHEAHVAVRLVRRAGIAGYLVGDSNYHAGALFEACRQHGCQLVAPRPASREGAGFRRNAPVPASRLRSVELTEGPGSFGRWLLGLRRRAAETGFAHLTTRAGLGPPPPHVRSLPRVRRWVQGAIILDLLARRRLAARTG
jgi:hypothetical protein